MRFEATPQMSKVTMQSSPLKGINAYDSIAIMPPGYALVLRNLFAQPYGCQVRRGFVRHADGLLGTVETLASHNALTKALYAFVQGGATASMYDVTVAGGDPIEMLTDLTNARWQHINFPNSAGVNLVAVNGADDLIWVKQDGTIVTVVAGDGTGSTIKNIDPKKLISVYSHQKRLWFVEKDSTFGWYLPPDQITGEAAMFDFGTNWVRGGQLSQIITWTIDDGNGSDDHLAAISTEGEVSIYQGIDPDSVESWQLQGVYYAGAPTGRRAACRLGGDILIVTKFGTVMLSDLLKSTKVNPTEANYGKYIQQLVSVSATKYGDKFGWQPFVFPGANMVMINIPYSNEGSFQFVLNDITKAWSEFIGYQARCWELHEQLPFYGSLGAVYRAWEGATDDAFVNSEGDVELGTPIRSEAQTMYSNFDTQVLNKHFKMIRPSVLSAGQFSVSVAVNVNYSFQSTQSPVSFDSYLPGRWDEDFWNTARWAGGLQSYSEWITVRGIGFTASLRLLIESTSETYWASTDWLFEPGGVM